MKQATRKKTVISQQYANGRKGDVFSAGPLHETVEKLIGAAFSVTEAV
jgi:hypothetical protein